MPRVGHALAAAYDAARGVLVVLDRAAEREREVETVRVLVHDLARGQAWVARELPWSGHHDRFELVPRQDGTLALSAYEERANLFAVYTFALTADGGLHFRLRGVGRGQPLRGMHDRGDAIVLPIDDDGAGRLEAVSLTPIDDADVEL